MRKTALKKLYPNRNKIMKFLRGKNQLTEIMSRKGTPICLNLIKHLLLQEPYKNGEYTKELLRFAKHNMSAQKESKKEENNDRSISQKKS